MAVTVAGTFADRGDAEAAVERLRAAGIPSANISLIVRGEEVAPPPVNVDTGVHGGAVVPEAVNPVAPGVEPVVATRVEDDEITPVTDREMSATATGMAAGSIIGGLGGFILGLVTLAVPGIGPVLAAGPIAAALGGVAVGAAAGGLLGALTEVGLEHDYARAYAADIERGHALVTVQADEEMALQARSILADAGALNITPAEPAVAR